MILLFIPLSVIVVLVFISYLLNFNIALSILLFIGAIYHLYIIFKDGIRKEDFKKKNIENMLPLGAPSLIWLILTIMAIFFLTYIEPINFIFFN